MLFKLFIVYLQIGLFSFGGGYAAIPLFNHFVLAIINGLVWKN